MHARCVLQIVGRVINIEPCVGDMFRTVGPATTVQVQLQTDSGEEHKYLCPMEEVSLTPVSTVLQELPSAAANENLENSGVGDTSSSNEKTASKEEGTTDTGVGGVDAGAPGARSLRSFRVDDLLPRLMQSNGTGAAQDATETVTDTAPAAPTGPKKRGRPRIHPIKIRKKGGKRGRPRKYPIGENGIKRPVGRPPKKLCDATPEPSVVGGTTVKAADSTSGNKPREAGADALLEPGTPLESSHASEIEANQTANGDIAAASGAPVRMRRRSERQRRKSESGLATSYDEDDVEEEIASITFATKSNGAGSGGGGVEGRPKSRGRPSTMALLGDETKQEMLRYCLQYGATSTAYHFSERLGLKISSQLVWRLTRDSVGSSKSLAGKKFRKPGSFSFAMHRMTPEQKRQIVSFAKKHGTTKAAAHCSHSFGFPIAQSTVAKLKKQYREPEAEPEAAAATPSAVETSPEAAPPEVRGKRRLTKYTAEDRRAIAEYTAKHGAVAASQHFTSLLKVNVPVNTCGALKAKYQKNKTGGGSDENWHLNQKRKLSLISETRTETMSRAESEDDAVDRGRHHSDGADELTSHRYFRPLERPGGVEEQEAEFDPNQPRHSSQHPNRRYTDGQVVYIKRERSVEREEPRQAYYATEDEFVPDERRYRFWKGEREARREMLVHTSRFAPPHRPSSRGGSLKVYTHADQLSRALQAFELVSGSSEDDSNPAPDDEDYRAHPKFGSVRGGEACVRAASSGEFAPAHLVPREFRSREHENGDFRERRFIPVERLAPRRSLASGYAQEGLLRASEERYAEPRVYREERPMRVRARSVPREMKWEHDREHAVYM